VWLPTLVRKQLKVPALYTLCVYTCVCGYVSFTHTDIGTTPA
jgi:hypothetical protein